MPYDTDPAAARELVRGASDYIPQADGPAPLTERQQTLERYWDYYRCEQYSGRRVDWLGREQLDPFAHEQVAREGYLPPGFYEPGQTLPLKFRRPTAPLYLARVVVDRFTGLLFSEKRVPKVAVDGDPDTTDFLAGVIEATNLWSTWAQARTLGGGMGGVGVGFTIRAGRIVLELHDARTCLPDLDPHTGDVRALVVQWSYPEEVRTSKGVVVQWFWYRRVIDDKADTEWRRIPVGDGREPAWAAYPNAVRTHTLGFCPVVWVKNTPVLDDVDGDPDCHGAWELLDAIDALVAQAHRGTLATCDPTTVIATDDDLDSVATGTDNAIKVEKGGSAQYLEISGMGPKTAMEIAADLVAYFLQLVRCYLDSTKDKSGVGGAATATEIERNYSSMLERADLLRAQYGQRGIVPLLRMILIAARKLTAPRVGTDPVTGLQAIVRPALDLPPRIVSEGADGRATFAPRVLGPSDHVKLTWPAYFHPTLQGIETAVRAIALALTSGLIDDETAVRFLTQYLPIDDPKALVDKLRKTASAPAEGLDKALMARPFGR